MYAYKMSDCVSDQRAPVIPTKCCMLFQAHMERMATAASPKEKNSKVEIRHLQEEVMTVKLREAKAVADLKETKQKVMELETQVREAVRVFFV